MSACYPQSSVLWKMIYGFAAIFHYCLTTLNLARQAFSVDGERRRALPRQRIRWEPNEVRIVYLLALKDKISFVLGVANLVFVTWLLGAYPEYFYLLYSVEVPLVIAYRLYRYRRIKQHYYLFDFCYWVNALLLFYIWIDRSSYMLFQALWLFTMGPLSWSVMTFGNSLVFHSSDKMSSIAIHLLPSWTCYTIRWMMPPSAGFRYCEYDPDAAVGAAACRADLRDMYLVGYAPDWENTMRTITLALTWRAPAACSSHDSGLRCRTWRGCCSTTSLCSLCAPRRSRSAATRRYTAG